MFTGCLIDKRAFEPYTKVYVRLARFGDFEVFETMTKPVHFSRKSEFAGVRLPG